MKKKGGDPHEDNFNLLDKKKEKVNKE